MPCMGSPLPAGSRRRRVEWTRGGLANDDFALGATTAVQPQPRPFQGMALEPPADPLAKALDRSQGPPEPQADLGRRVTLAGSAPGSGGRRRRRTGTGPRPPRPGRPPPRGEAPGPGRVARADPAPSAAGASRTTSRRSARRYSTRSAHLRRVMRVRRPHRSSQSPSRNASPSVADEEALEGRLDHILGVDPVGQPPIELAARQGDEPAGEAMEDLAGGVVLPRAQPLHQRGEGFGVDHLAPLRLVAHGKSNISRILWRGRGRSRMTQR